jgi:hypothetical protein
MLYVGYDFIATDDEALCLDTPQSPTGRRNVET